MATGGTSGGDGESPETVAVAGMATVPAARAISGNALRGAIRAALPDWLAVSPHADQIVALRPAHISHGGAGALYVILRRSRDD